MCEESKLAEWARATISRRQRPVQHLGAGRLEEAGDVDAAELFEGGGHGRRLQARIDLNLALGGGF